MNVHVLCNKIQQSFNIFLFKIPIYKYNAYKL